jgi:hypothetical protein
MTTTRTQTKLISKTIFGINVTTCIETQQTTVYHRGKLIYKKPLCGSEDFGSAHLNNVLDFMRHAKTGNLNKPLNF